ncbi:MAG TPA: S26 family signal peptidase [Gemmataceae bacterium]|nr:S26 family signal peptidase [Gemmataceae bacterium]
MAEEHKPTPPSDPIAPGTPLMPPTSRQVTASLPPEPIPAHIQVPAPSRPRSELENFARWLLGIFVIVACGWGLLFFGWWITKPTGNPELGPLVGSVISLGLFLWFEQDFWLSRFMSLHVSPNSSPLKSAILMFLLGLVYLMVYALLRSTVPQPVAASAHTKEQAAEAPLPQNTDGTREIIETIVFVVVLVLLLKTFLAEAFVIPTGSMAPTLLGYHKHVKCEKCGFEILVNASSEVEDRPPNRVSEWQCPNCRYKMYLRVPPPQPQEDPP